MKVGNYRNAVFERLPMAWQRTYKLTKAWFLARRAESALNRPSLREEFSAHWITVVTGCAIIAGTAAIRAIAGSDVALGLFYVVGCAIPTLVINRRWGTITAVICTLTVSVLRVSLHFDPLEISVLFWNVVMRFLFFEMFVILLDLVRIEMNKFSEAGNAAGLD
jgi:hypothetical protein